MPKCVCLIVEHHESLMKYACLVMEYVYLLKHENTTPDGEACLRQTRTIEKPHLKSKCPKMSFSRQMTKHDDLLCEDVDKI